MPQSAPAPGVSRTDQAILAGAVLAGILLMWSIARADRGLPAAQRQLGGQSLIEVIFTGTAAGLAMAGPVVLPIQRWRGRTAPFTLGEALWLVPAVLFLTAVAGSRWLPQAAGGGFGVFASWVAVQSTASLFAAVRLFRRDLTWSDRLGCVTCLLAGVAIWANLLLHPLGP